MKKKQPFIFVSYSHKDTQIVMPIINGLKERGFRVWYDAGIQAGTEWPEFIARKLYDCGCVLAVITQNSADSHNCRREINFAIELRKQLLAVYMVEPDDLSLGLRLQLNTLQAIFTKNSPDRESFLDTLSLAEILKPCKGEWSEESPEESEAIRSALMTQAESEEETPEKTQSQTLLWDDAEYQYTQGIRQRVLSGEEAALHCFLRAAELGHGEAMFQLAECYREGRGVSADDQEACRWLRKAAAQGSTRAMVCLAKEYELTNGTQRGREKAFLQFSIAAKLGDRDAMYQLGLCYLQGIGTEADPETAISWLEKAAELELVPAMHRLGMYYRYGTDGNPVSLEKARYWFDCAAYWRYPQSMYQLGRLLKESGDTEEAVTWYQRAAELDDRDALNALMDYYWVWTHRHQPNPQLVKWYHKGAQLGHAAAACCYGKCCEEGIEVPVNHEEAAQWYRKAAEMGDREGMCMLGDLLMDGALGFRDPQEAAQWYQKANDIMGHDHAAYRLSYCYRHGVGTPQDKKKAFELCRSAAERHHKEAAWALVDYHLQGIGTRKDPEQAFAWCKKAAEMGHTEAMYALRWYYSTGTGTEQDPEQAFAWCKRAAEQGHDHAMYLLGTYYTEGYGTEVTPSDAFAWFQRASAKGNVDAMYAQALCCLQGFGTPESEPQAMRLLDELSWRQHGDALYQLAQLYLQWSRRQAYRYMQQAAEAGSAPAFGFIKTDRQYQWWTLCNPFAWGAHRRAIGRYWNNPERYHNDFRLPEAE